MSEYEIIQNSMINAYQNLLEVQYYSKKKAREHIKALIKPLLANGILWRLKDEWLNIENATGKQLDQIGKWVGISRTFKGQVLIDGNYFSYWDNRDITQPNEKQGHYVNADALNSDTDFPWLDASQVKSVSNSLNDNDYRLLIKLKIIKNHINMTCKNIDDAIHDTFWAYGIYTVWSDVMTLTYKFPKSQKAIMEIAKQRKVLPCPSGCRLILETINE